MTPPYEELFDSSVALEKQNCTPDALAVIPTCKGVLLFVDSNHRPIQLLQTANLRRTARTKLFHHDEGISKRTNISTLASKIYWRCCYNDFLTQTHYIQIANAIFERQADEIFQLPRPCFSVIEMGSYLPFFDVSNNPAISEKRIVYGLFPSRKAAGEFSKILNSVFCLCQNPTLLKTGRESSCPYLQMKKCPKPCLDLTQKESYLERCHEAIQNANGQLESSLNTLNQRMDKASKSMNFEKASELRKQIDQLKKIQKPDFRWVHDLRSYSILHVDRTFKKSIEWKRKRIQQYQWFKIDAEAIHDLGFFSPASRQEIDCFLEENWTTGSVIPFPENIKKHLSNLSFFLYRTKSSGVWVDCSDGIVGDQLYADIERLLGAELPAYRAEKKDAE
ncbi:MAG: UvrB/UvrC motif-containing protein [Planctomycetota bacterium]|jgi:hypothetical protein